MILTTKLFTYSYRRIFLKYSNIGLFLQIEVVRQIKERNTQLETDIQNERQKTVHLEAKLDRVGHFESGLLNVSLSSSPGKTIQYVSEKFQSPYVHTPHIVLGTTRLNYTSQSDHIRFEASVNSADTQGFTVRIHTWDLHVDAEITVDWVSVPRHV